MPSGVYERKTTKENHVPATAKNMLEFKNHFGGGSCEKTSKMLDTPVENLKKHRPWVYMTHAALEKFQAAMAAPAVIEDETRARSLGRAISRTATAKRIMLAPRLQPQPKKGDREYRVIVIDMEEIGRTSFVERKLEDGRFQLSCYIETK